MPQIARPKQYTPAQPDVSQGLWTPTPIYPNINALNFDPNDQKFVTSGNVTGDTFEDLLSGMAWPDLTNPLETLTVRLKKTDSASIGATIKLMQGATLIAFLNVHPTTSFANYVLTLTQSQISVITNYADLRVRVTAGFITVQVPCCPNPVPEVLNATITGGYSLSFALLYNSTAGVWNGTSGALCNNPTNWALKCLRLGPVFHWFLAGDGTAYSPNGCSTLITQATSENCSPLNLVFNMTGAGGLPGTCCDHVNFQVTITS